MNDMLCGNLPSVLIPRLDLCVCEV